MKSTMAATKGGSTNSDERYCEEECVIPNAGTLLKQALPSVILMTAVIASGNALKFTSSPHCLLVLQNPDDASYMLSVFLVTIPLGILCNAFIMDAYGPRSTILFATISKTVGWFLQAYGQVSLPLSVYVGPSLITLGHGACLLPSIVYIAENNNDGRMRSTIGAWVFLSNVMGGLLMFVSSQTLTYRGVAVTFGTLSTISVLLILKFIPESPAWLYKKGRVADAVIAQERLGIRQVLPRNKEDDSTFVSCEPSSELNSCSLKNVMLYVSQIRRPDVYKPTMITIAFIFFCNFSYVFVVSLTMELSLTNIWLKSETDALGLSLILQIFQIIVCLILTVLMPYVGIRVIATTSFLGAFICHFCLLVSKVNVIHASTIWKVAILSQIGMSAVSFSIVGELFPFGAKGYATLPLFSSALLMIVNSKIIFPYLLHLRSRHIVCYVCTSVCALGAVFVAAFLPETVGKTTKQINESFFVSSNIERKGEQKSSLEVTE